MQIDDPALTYYCDRRLMSGEQSHDERLQRDWDPDKDACLTCGGVGSDCTCCQNCGTPYVRGRFGFCNGCAPFLDPHPAGCMCGDCPQNWGANG